MQSTTECGCFCHKAPRAQFSKPRDWACNQYCWHEWHIDGQWEYIWDEGDLVQTITLHIYAPKAVLNGHTTHYDYDDYRTMPLFKFHPPIFHGLQDNLPESIVKFVQNKLITTWQGQSGDIKIPLSAEEVKFLIAEGYKAGCKLRLWTLKYL